MLNLRTGVIESGSVCDDNGLWGDPERFPTGRRCEVFIIFFQPSFSVYIYIYIYVNLFDRS